GHEPVFTDVLELDLSTVEPSMAGPKRPQDRVLLKDAKAGFAKSLPEIVKGATTDAKTPVGDGSYAIGSGDVVIAAITSCTNTSNPSVLVAAGLVARNARAKGLAVKPWVKTSFAPGSQVVTDYLTKAGLQAELDGLGFNLTGYGCTVCIGNSGPLPEPVSKAIADGNLVAAAVLSGNRNFEGRVHAEVKANYLASPPLVVAYALAGTLNKDLTTEPTGQDEDGKDVFLRDIWPSSAEIAAIVRSTVTPEAFSARYADVFKGDPKWQALGKARASLTYGWNSGSTYVQNPPYFEGIT